MVRTAFGLTCPACGEGPLFRSYWTLRERCPDCGVVFERADGAGLGVVVVGYTVGAVAGLAAVGIVAGLFGRVPGLVWIGAVAAGVAIVGSWRWCKAWWTWLLWASGLVFRDDDPGRAA